MKKTRKLIPALAMLLLSAVMMSTASFAWFSMNASVTATGISVSANSDSTSLIISNIKNSTLESIRRENSGKGNYTVSLGSATQSLKPSAYTSKKISTGADFATVGNWYTGTSATVTDGTLNGSGTPLTGFNNYVITGKLYLALAAGSASGAANVTATVSITGTGVTPVKVILVSDKTSEITGNDYKEYVTTDGTTTDGGLVVDPAMTADEVVEIVYYVYYDGNDESVRSNNITSLGTATIVITFSTAGPITQ